jgi:hypothetical protein
LRVADGRLMLKEGAGVVVELIVEAVTDVGDGTVPGTAGRCWQRDTSSGICQRLNSNRLVCVVTGAQSSSIVIDGDTERLLHVTAALRHTPHPKRQCKNDNHFKNVFWRHIRSHIQSVERQGTTDNDCVKETTV